MLPTPEQRSAIETQGRPLIVEAGAGTGKTWVLVERFMHLLRTHPDWPLEGIAAVTFTEKAAREMRTRIRRRVQALAVSGETAKERAGMLARRQELERLQVSTIHGLCARILRENAIPAGIDPRFTVLDEQAAEGLKEQAILETINQMEANDHPGLALLDDLTVRDLRTHMAELLDQRGTVQGLFETLPEEEALLARWEAGLESMRREIWARLAGDPSIQEALDFVPAIEIFDPEDKLAEMVTAAQRGCRRLGESDLRGAVVLWKDVKLNVGRQSNWGGKEALTELKGMLEKLREAAKVLEKSGALQEIGEFDRQAARHLQLWKGVWETLNQVYDGLKAEQAALDFDDLELRTVRLLEGKPRSRRLQAYLDGIRHLLVDEFQDTNGVQQRIVNALTEPLSAGRLFVVGDAKQSIYRFRQAQVSIFNRMMAKIEAVSGAPVVPLNRSFRAHTCLVAGMNALFEVIFQPQGQATAEYEARPGPLVAQRNDYPAGQPEIELLLLPRKDGSDETIKVDDARIWEAQWLAQRLAALKTARVPVWDKDLRRYRSFEFGDAAVLFRATTSLPLYEREFKAAGIPYLTVSGRGYYARPEVQDLLALLSALHNPSDDLNLAVALRSPLFCLSDDTLYLLRWRVPGAEPGTVDTRPEEPVPYRQALANPPQTSQTEEVCRADAVLRALWATAGRVEVGALLRQVLDLTGFEAVLVLNDEASGRQRSNVAKLLALARQVGGVSLAGFLRQIRSLQDREAREGEASGQEPASGAVQLMSIHASKGLEFPVVFAADLGRKPHTGGAEYILHDPDFGLVCKTRDRLGDWQKPAGYTWGAWLNAQMETAESKRLLYVACTRAADKLVLSGRLGEKNSWLAEILDAWGIAPEGEMDELVDAGEYAIRVYRPLGSDEADRREAVRSVDHRQAFTLPAIPALAGPLALPVQAEARRTWAVTKLAGERVTESPGLRTLPPAGQQLSGVPGYVLGNILHAALADWESLSEDEDRQIRRLERIAKQEGVRGPENLAQVIRSAVRTLAGLRRSAIYRAVQGARRRLQEVPFQLDSPVGVLHGVIDLLYQDDTGAWHVLDWKTEWLGEGLQEQAVVAHLAQLAVYVQAVREIMGVEPVGELCFLRPQVVLVTMPEEWLQESWEKLMSGWSGLRSM